MVNLIAIGQNGDGIKVASAPFFRITGGSVWITPDAVAGIPLVRYIGKCWRHRDVLWSGLRFEGKCRLILGVPADPAGVSDEMSSIGIERTTLAANGVPFAVYHAESDMWRGAGGETWWHAFRVESANMRRMPAGTHHRSHELGARLLLPGEYRAQPRRFN